MNRDKRLAKLIRKKEKMIRFIAWSTVKIERIDSEILLLEVSR